MVPGAFSFMVAPVYNCSPSGKCLVVLQAVIRQIKRKVMLVRKVLITLADFVDWADFASWLPVFFSYLDFQIFY